MFCASWLEQSNGVSPLSAGCINEEFEDTIRSLQPASLPAFVIKQEFEKLVRKTVFKLVD
jgi:hypothetical protein